MYQPINLTAATLTLSRSTHLGAVITVNRAAGTTITLPASAGKGDMYRVFCGTTITSNSLKVQVANATDIMSGAAWAAADGGSSVVGWETASDSDTITMDGSTTGGIKGDFIELIDVTAGVWFVRVMASATGTEATPFSAAVS